MMVEPDGADREGRGVAPRGEVVPGGDWAEIVRLMREARERGRGYADYWQWPLDKAIAERDVARILLRFLAARDRLQVASLAQTAQDPPDCVARLADGQVVGIEVTELVDEGTVARHSRRLTAVRRCRKPRMDAADAYDEAVWDAASLRGKLSRIVAGKDVAAEGGPYRSYLVAIHTDETTVTPDLLTEAIVGAVFRTAHVDAAFLLFSYHPDADEQFPDGIRVVELPVQRGG